MVRHLLPRGRLHLGTADGAGDKLRTLLEVHSSAVDFVCGLHFGLDLRALAGVTDFRGTPLRA